MKRREALRVVLVLATSVKLSVALGQPARPPRRIALLVPGTRETYGPLVDSFRARLKDLGYAEDRDVVIESRWSEGRSERLSALAAEVVALQPAVIVTGSSGAVRALKARTQSVPIVFAHLVEPVEQGFVASLRRPGGNITGVTLSDQVAGKLAELIRETLPRAARIVMLAHENDPASDLVVKEFARPAAALGFELRVVDVKHAEELEKSFADIATGNPDAIFVATLAFYQVLRRRVAALALKARVPLFSNREEQTDAGGLISYANDVHENYRRVAVLVDKILKGTNAGDLPVEQPHRFNMVVNLKTARALGIHVPPSILLRADRVIE